MGINLCGTVSFDGETDGRLGFDNGDGLLVGQAGTVAAVDENQLVADF